MLLTACGGGGEPEPLASRGQVDPPSTAKVTRYAAARFAEQATFGVTPAVVADIQAKGFSGWIDAQFALPATQIDPAPLLTPASLALPPGAVSEYLYMFPDLAIGAPDQLRARVTWSLAQYIVTSSRKVDIIGIVYWANMLQRQAFGRYDQLLTQVSISPAMGWYLDNVQNRPKSANCPTCAPNENYARELMQLFSLGVYKVRSDGSFMLDANGRRLETYTQKDVEQLSRVLTGWTWDPVPADRPGRLYGNWGKPMVPSPLAADRDNGTKLVLGKTFPAGQTHAKDLQDAVTLLTTHPNAAPFVARRLIQHLVKSHPTPAYLGRVAAVFRNNGAGVVGDMKAVIKAVLLDAEARAGDNPATARADDGKLREPFLHYTALWRGLGCQRAPRAPATPLQQTPFNAASVFGFYSPSDRAPGSNLPAPEIRLLNSGAFAQNLDRPMGMYFAGGFSGQLMRDAGCDFDGLVTAYKAGADAFADYLEPRWFRSRVPPNLRADIEPLMSFPVQWSAPSPEVGALQLLGFILGSTWFGAIL